MKKTTLFISSACFLLSLKFMAQPTLTAVGINPVAGDQFVNTSSAYMSPGNAGASQTWNLSTLSNVSTSTLSVLAASASTYGTSFPNSNIATTSNNTSFEYFATSSSAYQSYGSGNSSIIDSYTNPEDRLRFPFTYGNSYTDAFTSVYTNGSTTMYRNGTTTVTADGYGTLTTPVGSFSNVLRINSTYMYHDSSNTGGTPSVLVYQRSQYIWYLNGNHAPLATISSFTITPATGSPVTNQGANYLNNTTTGIEPINNTLALCEIFPNPATDKLTVGVTLHENKKVTIKLYNYLGELVLNTPETMGITGNTNYSIDVNSLSNGVYFTNVYLDGQIAVTKKFVVAN